MHQLCDHISVTILVALLIVVKNPDAILATNFGESEQELYPIFVTPFWFSFTHKFVIKIGQLLN